MILIFLAELFLLFLLSRFLTRELSFLFYRLSKSKTISSYLLAIIFLPGTFVHEASHALVAKILFAYVGKMELIPQLDGENLKLGSVEVGKTDFVRNFFIGVAPFFVGTILILSSMWYVFSKNLLGVNLMTAIVLYLIFVISNTMYSSKKDLEGAMEFFIFVILVVGLLLFIGARPSDLGFLSGFVAPNVLKQGVYLLLIPVGIDIISITMLKLLNKGVRT